MIGYLKGKLTFKSPTYVYVECYGVGYHVNISLNTFTSIKELEEVKLFTFHSMGSMNDPSMSLYGFFAEDERSLYKLLVSISGVGKNTALTILSYKTSDEIRGAILNDDPKTFSSVKGIGPKTAKRIILDLRDKVSKEMGTETILGVSSNNIIEKEALSALVALGFPKQAIEKQIKRVLSQNSDISQVEDLIKAVLKQIS